MTIKKKIKKTTAQEELKRFVLGKDEIYEKKQTPEIKKRTGKHAITHVIVKNKFKKSGPLILFFIIGWLFLILAIANKAFLFLSGTSILDDFFNFIFNSLILRITFFLCIAWTLIEFARALGQAGIVQPFERFISHLQKVNSKGGEKFILRKKDIHFIPVVIAFNQMINRIRLSHEKNKENFHFLISIVESNKIKLSEKEQNILKNIKKDLNASI